MTQPPFTVKAKADYSARNDTEISLKAHQTYTVLQTDGQSPPLWYQANDAGKAGWFPVSYVDTVADEPAPAPAPPPAPEQAQEPVKEKKVKDLVVPDDEKTVRRKSSRRSSRSSRKSSRSVKVDDSASKSRNDSTSKTRKDSENGSGRRKKEKSKKKDETGSGKKKSTKKEKKEKKPKKEEPPTPMKETVENGNIETPSFLVLQVVEAKDMKTSGGDSVKCNPTAFVFRKHLLQDPDGSMLFKTASMKKTNAPTWNEKFHMNVFDSELEVIQVRFASGGKKGLKGKNFMGQVDFTLRSSVRDFDKPDYQFKWYPIMNDGQQTGEAKIFVEFIDTRAVSKPKDFQQVSHIGWSADGGFDINNIPNEWKKIFKSVGLRKKDLEKNPELAGDVLKIMNEAADTGTPLVADTPAPPPPPDQKGSKKKREKSKKETQTDTAKPVTTTTAPPPPPASTGVAVNTTGAPPPPPPPPIVTTGVPPPPPPPPPSGSGASTGGGLLSGLANVQLNSAPAQDKPAPPSGGGGLLDQIRNGIALKETSNLPPPPPPSSGGGLAATLQMAMLNHRSAIEGDDESSSGDDWSSSE